jgi:SAM-dependent methyltransferase
VQGGLRTTSEACPLCEHEGFRIKLQLSDRLYGTTDKQFSIVECNSCRALWLSPRPAPSELTRYYPAGYWFSRNAGLADTLANAYRRLVLLDHLWFVRCGLRKSKACGTVLDVGCGGGLFLSMLWHEPRPIVGLDTSESACAIAWNKLGVAAVCGTLTSAPFRPESCAAITMFHG